MAMTSKSVQYSLQDRVATIRIDDGKRNALSPQLLREIYQALDRYNPKYKFSTWLFRVAQNAAIDRIRKRRLKLVSMDRTGGSDSDMGTWEFPSSDPDPYGDLRNVERGTAIQAAIDRLPWDYR